MRKYIGKIVRCINDGRIFRSTSAASRYYGINQGNICGVCNGRQESTCGYKFEYIKEPSKEIILALREAENEI